MHSMWKVNSKRLALCASFGGAAFALRALNIMIPIGGPFVIDFREVPGIVGAALAGPIGGLIIGVLAGIPAKFPIVDVPAFGVAYFLVGLTTHSLRRHRWMGGLMVISGYIVAATIVWIIGLVPLLSMALFFILPRAVTLIPIQMMLLYAIFKRWRNFDAA